MTLAGYIGQLQALTQRLQQSMDRLERERGYLLESMDKVQGTFGDQQAGSQMVTDLFQALNHAAMADSALYAASVELKSYINQISNQ